MSSADYTLIMANLRQVLMPNNFSRKDAEELEAELRKAKVVEADKVPGDVVRLDSAVKLQDEQSKKIMDVTLVIPEKADLRQKKISVLSPVGTAIIGYRKGKKVSWQVPSGEKVFTILDVQPPNRA